MEDPTMTPDAPPPASRQPMVDPDSRARTHMANERTFLAWFRTGLVLVAFGLAGAQFLSRDVVADFPLVRALSTVAVGTGIFLVIVGAWRYHVDRIRIDAVAFVPASRSILIATASAVIAGVLAIAFIWFLRPL